ncbi:MAG: IclR family transcriptional regulator [Lawsonibacter sp.]|nr:IclR family transcriptional regulator [Lawsonibacter sp.]
MSSTKSILSLEKALSIIEIMANDTTPMRLLDIANTAGIPTSTALRLVGTLQAKGYVCQDPATARYYLSLKLFHIGNRICSGLSITYIAKPYLKELAAQTGHSVNLAVHQDYHAFIVNVTPSFSENGTITTYPGRAVPLHSSAIGRALMFDYTPEQIDEYLETVPLTAYTALSILDRETLILELERSRKRGYTYDPGELRPGIVGIGAPILDQFGHPIASISVAELSSAITPELNDSLSQAIIQTTKKISSII